MVVGTDSAAAPIPLLATEYVPIIKNKF